MARYIDADELIKKIFPYDVVDKKRYVINAEAVYKAIQNVTAADVVEVVRCKDCKQKGWVQEPCHGKTIDFCKLHEFCVKENDFCSYGERKEK